MYQKTKAGFVRRLADNAEIPADPNNRDYAAYQAWLAAGNTAPVEPNTPTAADVIAFREARLAAGYTDATTGKTYPCDHDSQRLLTAVGSSAGFARGGPAKTFPLIATDGSVVQLNPADAFALTNDRIMPWIISTLLYAKGLMDAIRAGKPPTDITVGWP